MNNVWCGLIDKNITLGAPQKYEYWLNNYIRRLHAPTLVLGILQQILRFLHLYFTKATRAESSIHLI